MVELPENSHVSLQHQAREETGGVAPLGEEVNSPLEVRFLPGVPRENFSRSVADPI